MSGNWWDILPREAYANLEKVETKQPWYSVYRLHDWLYCIYEDGQYDETVMYLVIGKKEAIVIDGGTGIGRLDLLVEELTDKPNYLVLTHTHNDHIGGCKHFKNIALCDSPQGWESAAKGLGKEKMYEIIKPGYVWKDFPEGFDPESYYAPPYTVTRWLKDGDIIDLGGKKLEVLYTPGHSNDHVCLLDREARYLFTGDIYYTGEVTSFLPWGDHDQFIDSCKRLVDLAPHYNWLMSAHNEPNVEKDQMKAMYDAAVAIKEGTATDYMESRYVSVNYDLKVRRYQFERFSLTVRDPLVCQSK
jgi:glyoxylase-like metal-dependent hydrolase (beta-lactamase superfamily II)